LVLLAGALGGGLFLLARDSSPPPIEIVLPPLTAVPELKVYVSGAARQPGVYTLQPGARMAEAVQAAGGATQEADLSRVNLALRVRDEDHLHIPRVGEVLPTASPEGLVGKGLLDLNTATAAELEALPEIGKVTAQAIVDYRAKSGPFQRVEDLLKVPGIGPATLDKVRALVTVR
jgi:competence protein ComEA